MAIENSNNPINGQPPINPKTNQPYTSGELIAQKYLGASSPFDTYGGVTRQQASVAPGRDNFLDYGFSYQVGEDNEDRRAENQSAGEQWINGLGKFVGKTATAFAGGTIGTAYGLGAMIADGSFNSFYDNDFQRMLDQANKSMDESLPNYVSKEQQQYSLLRDMGTANFWANDVLGGASFTAGAILAEWATAGLASELLVSKTAKFLQESAKAGDVISDIARSGTAWAKAKNTLPTFTRQLMTGAGYEAGVEARNFKDQALQRLEQEYRERNGLNPEDEIPEQVRLQWEDSTNTAANGVFATNFALVSASNFATLPKTFNYGLRGGASSIEEGAIKAAKDLTETQKGNIVKNLGKELTDPYVNAYYALSKGEKIGKGIYNALKAPFTEGIIEEGGQGVISKAAEEYVSKQYDPNANLASKDLASAIGKGLGDTFGTKEGWKEMVVGMMIGGMSNVFEGGLTATTKKNAEIDSMVNWMNSNPSAVKASKEAWKNSVLQQKSNDKINKSMEMGDMFEAKNGEHDSFFSYVASRYNSGFYNTIEDDIVKGFEEMSDDEFKKDWLGDENLSKKEVAKRKQEVVESTKAKAKSIKNSLDLVNNSVHFKNYSDDVRLGAAYSLASVDNLDNREQSLVTNLVKLVGEDIGFKEDLYNKVATNKRAELIQRKEVKEYIKEREKIEKLGSLYTQEEKASLDKEIKESQKKLDKIVKESGLDFKTFDEGYNYYLSDKKFTKSLKAWVEQNESSPNKPEVLKSVLDLERIQQQRKGLIDEYNRLLTKEGAKKFEGKIDDSKKDILQKFGILNKDGSVNENGIASLAILQSDAVKSMEDLQKHLYKIKADKIKGAASEIKTESTTGVESEQPSTNDVELDSFIKEFKERLAGLSKINDTDLSIEKIKKLEDIIKEYRSTINKINKLVKKYGVDSIKGEKFQNYADSLEQALDELIVDVEALKNSQPKNTSGVVFTYAEDIGEFYTAFDYEGKAETEELLNGMTQKELNGVAVNTRFQVVSEGDETVVLKTNNPNVQRKTRNKGKSILITSKFEGDKIVLGSLYDPRGFIVNNKEFNPSNVLHIAEFNSEFVDDKGQLTDKGKAFQANAFAIIKQFEALDNLAVGESIEPVEGLFINARHGLKYIKRENRQPVSSSNKTFSIGKDKYQIIVEVTDGNKYKFFVKENGKWIQATGSLETKIKKAYKNGLNDKTVRSRHENINDRYRMLVNSVNSPMAEIALSYPQSTESNEDIVNTIVSTIENIKKEGKESKSKTILSKDTKSFIGVKLPGSTVNISLIASGAVTASNAKSKVATGTLILNTYIQKGETGETISVFFYSDKKWGASLDVVNGELVFTPNIKIPKDTVIIKDNKTFLNVIETVLKDRDNKLSNIKLSSLLQRVEVNEDGFDTLLVNAETKVKLNAVKSADPKKPSGKESKEDVKTEKGVISVSSDLLNKLKQGATSAPKSIEEIQAGISPEEASKLEIEAAEASNLSKEDKLANLMNSTPAQTDEPTETKNDSEISNDEESPFRLNNGEEATLKIQEAVETLSKILPIRTSSNPNGVISVQELTTLMTNLSNNGEAFGMFKDSIIYLKNKSAAGTEYHEAFHAVFRMLLTDSQIQLFLNEAEKTYGNPSKEDLNNLRAVSPSYLKLTEQQLKELWLEEKMADSFQKYATTRASIEKDNTFSRLWKKILKWMGIIQENETELDLFFSDIYEGKYRTASVKNNFFLRKQDKNPVYSLLKTASGSAYLTSEQSQRIINTIALKVSKAQQEDPEANEADLIAKAIQEQSDYYNINNWKKELESIYTGNNDGQLKSIVAKIKMLSEAIVSEDNKNTINKEVSKKLKFYNSNILSDISVEEDNEVAERSFDLSADQVGGLGSLSKEMRQYIAFTTVGIDEFGFGLRPDELASEKYQLATDAYTVYEGVVRLLSDTPNSKLLPQLREYVEFNTNAKGFYTKLISDIQNQLGIDDINSIIDNPEILKASNIYNKFVVAFKNTKFVQDMVLFDPKSKLYSRFNANTKDVDNTQLDRWTKNYLSTRFEKNPEEAVEHFEELSDLFNAAEGIITKGKFDFDILNFREGDKANLNTLVKKIVSHFNQMGVNLSPGYIKYSLISYSENIIQTNLDKLKESGEDDNKVEELESMLAFKNLFNKVDAIDQEFLTFLINSVKSAPYSPFREIKTSGKTIGGVLGNFRTIARGNAVFDESVSNSTYQNAEGKTIYDKVKNSFYLEEALRWKNRGTKIASLLKENITEEEAVSKLMEIYEDTESKLEEWQAKYMYQVLKNNPIFTQLSEEEVSEFFNELRIKGLSGIRQENLSKEEDLEGVQVDAVGSVISKGVDYGSLDARGKLLIDLVNFLPKQAGSTTDSSISVRIGTNEAKNTTYIVDFKRQNFYAEGGITTTAKKWLTDLFRQEYERINNVASEIRNGKDRDVIADVHDKSIEESNGTKFFNFTKLSIAKEARAAALAGTSFDEYISKIDLDKVFNEFVNTQIDTLIEKMASPEVALISMSDDKTEIKGDLLPKEYLDDNEINRDQLGDFFLNDYLHSFSFNSLFKGDLALSHKAFEQDSADVPKRNAQNVASGPDFGSGQSKIAIFKSLKIDGIDITDAQSLNSLDWYIHTYLKSQGKYIETIKPIFKKIKRGINLSFEEVNILRKYNADIRPRKIVGSSTFTYLKTSSHTLTRSLTSMPATGITQDTINKAYDELEILEDVYFNDPTDVNKSAINNKYKQIHNLWQAIPGKELLHSALNTMESKGIDIFAADSGIKTTKVDVGSVDTIKNTWNVVAHDVNNNIIREQVNTDNTKTEIVDGTQKMNLIWSEQGNVEIEYKGKKLKIKNIAGTYENLLSERIKKGFEVMRKALEKIGTDAKVTEANYTYLLESFQQSLGESGTDPYLMELFVSDTTGTKPKYNLNFPSILSKYEAMYLSFVSKNTLKHKAPGHKFTLVSDVGYKIATNKDKVVTVGELKKGDKYTGTRRLQHSVDKDSNGVIYSECVIPAQFAEMYGLSKGMTVPDKLLEAMGIRIPTQDKHSMVTLKIVDVLPAEYGTAIILPYEIIKLSGADFDIDSIYVRVYQKINSIFGNQDLEFYGDYKTKTSKSSILGSAFHEYLNYYAYADKRVSKGIKELLDASEYYKTLLALQKELSNSIKSIKNNSIAEELLTSLDLLAAGDISMDEFSEDFYSKIPSNYLDTFEKRKQIVNEKGEDAYEFLKGFISSISDIKNNNVTTKEIAKIKERLKELKRAKTHYKEFVSRLQLGNKGYETDFRKFKQQFEDQILKNVKAYSENNFEAIKPITTGETNNLLLEIERLLVENEGNAKIANTPSSLDIFKRLREIWSKENPSKPISYGVYSPLDKLLSSEANDTGKAGIGPAAIFNVLFQRFAKHKITLNPIVDKENLRLFEPIRLGGNTYDSFKSLTLPDGTRINDTISSILSAMTDNAKERFAAEFNLSKETLGPALLLVGMGVPFENVMTLMKQPSVVRYAAGLTILKSPIQTNKESKLTKQNIKEEVLEFYKYKKEEGIEESTNTELNVLKDSLFGKLNETNFKAVQTEALIQFVKAEKYSSALVGLSKVMSLSKGLPSSWSEVDSIFEALEELGYSVIKTKSSKGNNLSDYTIKRTGEVSEIPFLLDDLFSADSPVRTNLLTAKIIEHQSKDFFILQTETGQEFLNEAFDILSRRAKSKQDINNRIRRNLIAFLGATAWKKSTNKTYKVSDLFGTKLVEDLITLRAKYPDNKMLRYLTAIDPETAEPITSGNYKGEVFLDIIGNTRTKNNPDFQQQLMQDYKRLVFSTDPIAKDFALKLFDRIMMRDQLQFRNNGLVRLIEPSLLGKYMSSITKVQDLFAGKTTDFVEVFGLSKDKLLSEFVELFARDSKNKSDLISTTNFNLAEVNKEASTNKGESDTYPIWIDNNTGTLNINRFNGTWGKKELQQNVLDIMKTLSIFNTKPIDDFGNIYFPKFILYINKSEESTITKIYKRVEVTKSKQDSGSKEGYGIGANYTEVSTVGTSTFLPYAFNVSDFESYYYEKTIEEKEKPIEKKKMTEEEIMAKFKKSSKIAQSEGDPTPEFNSNGEQNRDTQGVETKEGEIKISASKLSDLTKKFSAKEQKESVRESVDKQTAIKILNGLSAKFGVQWKWDDSLPGLGQFKNGIVLINPNKFKKDTLFHEFAHPFVHAVKFRNPLLYKTLVSKVKEQKNVLDKVKKLYPELTEDDQIEESIVELIGIHASNVEKLKTEKQIVNLPTSIARIIGTFMSRVKEYIREILNIDLFKDKSKKLIIENLNPNTSFEELGALFNLDNEVNLSNLDEFKKISDKEVEEFIKKCK